VTPIYQLVDLRR